MMTHGTDQRLAAVIEATSRLCFFDWELAARIVDSVVTQLRTDADPRYRTLPTTVTADDVRMHWCRHVEKAQNEKGLVAEDGSNASSTTLKSDAKEKPTLRSPPPSVVRAETQHTTFTTTTSDGDCQGNVDTEGSLSRSSCNATTPAAAATNEHDLSSSSDADDNRYNILEESNTVAHIMKTVVLPSLLDEEDGDEDDDVSPLEVEPSRLKLATFRGADFGEDEEHVDGGNGIISAVKGGYTREQELQKGPHSLPGGATSDSDDDGRFFQEERRKARLSTSSPVDNTLSGTLDLQAPLNT